MLIASVASLVETLGTRKLLTEEQIQSLELTEDVDAAFEKLRESGRLTPFQIEHLRNGTDEALTIGGYVVVELLPVMEHGQTYRGLDPVTREPVTIRCLPVSEDQAYQEASSQLVRQLVEPHLMTVLADGIERGQHFQILPLLNGSSLALLIRDIGPMPASLAGDYVRQLGQGLKSIHDAGLIHGNLCPAQVFVGPLSKTSKTKPDGSPVYRPSSSAVVKWCDLAYSAYNSAMDSIAQEYLAPELSQPRVFTPASDIYAFGATVFYLLTARGPQASQSLSNLRPELPATFVSLILDMMSETPTSRPTIQEVIQRLDAIGKIPNTPPKAASDAVTLTAATPETEIALDHAPLDHVPSDFIPSDSGKNLVAYGDWAQPSDLMAAEDEDHSGENREQPAPRRRPMMSRYKMFLWIGIGLLFNVAGVAILYFAFFDKPAESTPAPQPTKSAGSNPQPTKSTSSTPTTKASSKTQKTS